MQKKILITGSTDGIGLETAKALLSKGHHVILHGRNPAKLEKALAALSQVNPQNTVEAFLADLSDLSEVEQLSREVGEKYSGLDVLINNAGILKTPTTTTGSGYDIRFIVNTVAPYFLTKRLLPLLDQSSRVINLSSAAQSPVNIDAMLGNAGLSDMEAYAQSKLAITMWSKHMADELNGSGVSVIAVNPGSLLATKMVKEGFGMAGNDVGIGADILVRASLSDEFTSASGKYYDNDSRQFASPHPDALDKRKVEMVVKTIEGLLEKHGISI